MRHPIGSLLLSLLLVSLPLNLPKAQAATGPGVFAYEGRLYAADGTTPLSGNVKLKLSVMSANDACTFYSEVSQVIDLTANSGYFSVYVGDGVPDTSVSGYTLQQVFTNGSALTGVNANGSGGCTQTPVSGSIRKLRVTVWNQGDGTQTVLSPNIVIGSSPSAMVADTLQGFGPSDLLKVNATTALTQSNLQSIFSSANYSLLSDLLAGTSSLYAKNVGGGVLLPTTGGTTTGSIWYDTGAQTVKFFDGIAARPLGLSAIGPTGTSTKVSYDTYGRVISGSSLIESDIPMISTAGKISGSALTSGTISGSTGINTSADLTSTGIIDGGLLRSSNAVVIGVAIPTNSEKLHVSGDAIINGSLTMMTKRMLFVGGSTSIGVGDQALGSSTSTLGNTAVGSGAMQAVSSGNYNVAIGQQALQGNSSGEANVVVGYQALKQSSSSAHNTMLGYKAGSNISSGAYENVVIGYNAGLGGIPMSSGNNNILIGANTGVINSSSNNFLNIGNTLFGSIPTSGSRMIGIDTPTPVATLDVNGFMKLRKYGAPPTGVTCDASTDGTIVMTNLRTLCVCNGTGWTETSNPANSCSWN